MPFNSHLFIFLFLPLSVAGFWLIARYAGRSAALGWLVLASLAFHVHAGVASAAIIAGSILTDYLIANAIVRLDSTRRRQRAILFAVSVTANILALAYLKYINFALDTTNYLLSTHLALHTLVLPLGISFITFQKVAFLADVHSGQVKSFELRDFLLFTLYFPRAIAGPIVHYQEMIPQLARGSARSHMSDISIGICLFSIGLFKKTVMSDGVSAFVPYAFGPPWITYPTLINAWAGVLSYTLQLYFDFSGYSDMALGTSRMFGVRLPMNFNSPLKSTSIVEFWSRWHITLTRFLTAYIYTPIVLHMARKRASKGRPVLRGSRTPLITAIILIGLPSLITMTISGIWHGAGFQFIIWGGLHGFYLTINQVWRMLRPRFWPDNRSYTRVMRPVGFVLTLLSVVVAFVFFRAPSVGYALSILRGMVGMNGILHVELQVLHDYGGNLPWSMIAFLQPIAPHIWIFGTLLAATLLPNSLELLRRFQPASDYPPETGNQSAFPASPNVWNAPLSPPHRSLIVRLGATEISLNRLGAVVCSLMFLLGVIAVGRSGPFLYGQF